MDETPQDPRGLGSRWPEAAVAALLFGFALLVIADSLRVGRDWAADGPRAGYFPFYIGLGLATASGAILIGQLLRWGRDRRVFVGRAEALCVWAVLWPTTLYVALIAPLGIYLSSAALIAWFMRRHGRYAAWLTAAVSIGVPLVVFLVFERWFAVSLPKGPIEQWLGF